MQLWYRTGNCHHGWHDNNWKTSLFYYSKLQQPWSIWSQTRKKMGGSGVWMQSNCISVKGINVYLDKKKQTKNMSFKIPYKIKRELYGKLSCKKNRNIPKVYSMINKLLQYFCTLRKNTIFYIANLASTIWGNIFYSG